MFKYQVIKSHVLRINKNCIQDFHKNRAKLNLKYVDILLTQRLIVLKK